MKMFGRALLTLSLLGAMATVAQANDKVLRVYNWSDYIAPDTLQKFEDETGIRVTYDAENPVLFINTHQALSDMAACAMHRFTVVRDLTDTLSSLNLKDISDCDLTRITRAVHLLTREGCAVLDVIQARLLQREEGFKTAM